MKFGRVFLVATLLVFSTAVPSFVFAQPAENAAIAEALFQEAQKLISEGKTSEACDKFVESDRLDPGLGTKLSIADCYEREGKLSKAWAAFTEIIPLAQQANRQDREALAKQRADALAPRIPKLVVTFAGDTKGVEVLRDGVALGSATFGVPLPIDPGKHMVAARAPGFKEWSTEVVVEEGKTLEVKVPALELDVSKPPPPPPPPPSGGNGLKVGGGVLLGLGVVGLGIGAGFGLKTFSTWEKAQDDCDGAPGSYKCGPTGETLAAEAQTSGNISTGLFIGGGVLAAAGVGMLVVGSRSKALSPKTGIQWIAPSFDGKNSGIVLQGRF